MISWVALQEDPSSVSQPMGVPRAHASSGMTTQGKRSASRRLTTWQWVYHSRGFSESGATLKRCVGCTIWGRQAVGKVLSGLGQFNKQSRARRDESTNSRLGSQVRREKRTTRRRATIRFRRPKGGTVPCDGANLTLIPDPQASPPSSHTPAASIHHFVLRRSIPPSHSWPHSPSDTHDFSGPHDN
jgi:hypothetical protein